MRYSYKPLLTDPLFNMILVASLVVAFTFGGIVLVPYILYVIFLSIAYNLWLEDVRGN